jgi:hypothetical protein
MQTLRLQEGWQPAAFSSSRSAPGQRQQQSVEQFMDEDELKEMQKKGLSLKVCEKGNSGMIRKELKLRVAAERAALYG